ncbi:MAG: sodium-dependent transporter [Deltaproteobacteria bacterium]|nr:sodium-dependent transporter [Deltaproteobacteria bacterium]
MRKREQWGTRIGLILAMAGNAIGLGNFLRFPVQAAENGGGAFMIPYFVSFLVMGIPLMWVEWGIGRYGGTIGHGSAPAIFDSFWKNRFAKYVGILGIFLPIVVLVYYTYVASWTLAFSLSSVFGYFPGVEATVAATTPLEYLGPYSDYLGAYIGADAEGSVMTPSPLAYIFFFFTLCVSLFVLAKGIVGGIEKLCKVAIPTLFVLSAVLFIRIITLDSPSDPSMTTSKAFSFLWEPDLSGLLNPDVWLAAAGQVFFTLSLGMGAVLTYASYVKKDEDIALDGLSAASLNMFAEVIFGSTIAITSAVIFFGMAGAEEVASQGAFGLGLVSMPAIFAHMPAGEFFGFLWFGLLYVAALTSIVALSQPAMAFFEDEFDWTRKKSAAVIGVFFVLSVPLPMFLKGSLDELDFWVGTFALVILALFEMILFFWCFGAEKAWSEITRGAHIRIPKVFFYLMKYVTPVFLVIILIAWGQKSLSTVLSAEGVGVWAARAYLVALLALHIFVVEYAWAKKKRRKNNDD